MRALGLLFLCGCDAASANPGLEAFMRVEDAQYVPGPMPADSGGPVVTAVANAVSTVQPSETGKTLRGALAPGATVVALGLAGDRGYWLAPAGPPTFDAPGEPSFVVTLSFAPTTPLGPTAIIAHALDAAGRAGPARTEAIAVADEAMPAGPLVISLVWDRNADLDLHVVDPDGVEIWARNINSYQAPPPGTPVDPDAWRAGGILDFDSNANCALDGRRRENVVWTQTPPSGTYVVRVDPASMCGEPDARWRVSVARDGVVGTGVGEQATGVFVEASTRGKHGPGDGLEVLTFEVP